MIIFANVVSHLATRITFCIAALVFLLTVQCFVWLIARYTADTEFWRRFAFCVVTGMMCFVGYAITEEWIAAWVFGAFAGYLIAGFVYDLELWQRFTLAAVGPVLGFLALLACKPIENFLLTKLFT